MSHIYETEPRTKVYDHVIKEIIKQHLTVEVYKRVGWFGASDIVVRLKLDGEIISEDNMTLTEGSES